MHQMNGKAFHTVTAQFFATLIKGCCSSSQKSKQTSQDKFQICCDKFQNVLGKISS